MSFYYCIMVRKMSFDKDDILRSVSNMMLPQNPIFMILRIIKDRIMIIVNIYNHSFVKESQEYHNLVTENKELVHVSQKL